MIESSSSRRAVACWIGLSVEYGMETGVSED